MAVIRWEPDLTIREKAFHFRSSLNPLGDAVRDATDDLHRKVMAEVNQEIGRWEDQQNTTKTLLKSDFRNAKARFYRAKAMAYSLRAYRSTLKAIMVKDADENYGAVVSYHAAGDSIEFGGVDQRITEGRGESAPNLMYPAFGFLRRAL